LMYENGDENLDINALTNLPVFIEQNHAANGTMEVNAFPNPFTEFIQLEMELTSSSIVSLHIYDQNGRRVANLAEKVNLGAGLASFQWTPDKGTSSGTYFYSLRVNGANSSGVIQFQ
jgi:flagellar hook assembly protein FlgD